MELLALFLAFLAFLLAVPVPRILSTAAFRSRSPWSAMILWQAIALAGGLSIVGAPLVYGLAPFGDSLVQAVSEVGRLMLAEDYSALAEREVHPTHIFSLCLGVVVGAHLLLTLLRTYMRVLASRRRHRDMVRLLSTPVDGSPGADLGKHTGLGDQLDDAHVIEHDAPLAYCLPGRTSSSSVTVLSRGLLNQLSGEELAAVVAHERTHLQQRHHLLTMAFDAWYRALPWLPTTRYGREAVLELTEMLADDGALQKHSREDLLRSLALSSPEEAPEDAELGQHTSALITGVRLKRLISPPEPLGRPAVSGVVASAAALLLVPTGLLLAS